MSRARRAAVVAGWLLLLCGLATVATLRAPNPLPGVAAIVAGTVILALTERHRR